MPSKKTDQRISFPFLDKRELWGCGTRSSGPFVLEKEWFQKCQLSWWNCYSLLSRDREIVSVTVTMQSSLAKGEIQWLCIRRHMAVSLPRLSGFCLSHLCLSQLLALVPSACGWVLWWRPSFGAAPDCVRGERVRLRLVTIRIFSPVLQNPWSPPRSHGLERTAILSYCLYEEWVCFLC